MHCPPRDAAAASLAPGWHCHCHFGSWPIPNELVVPRQYPHRDRHCRCCCPLCCPCYAAATRGPPVAAAAQGRGLRVANSKRGPPTQHAVWCSLQHAKICHRRLNLHKLEKMTSTQKPVLSQCISAAVPGAVNRSPPLECAAHSLGHSRHAAVLERSISSAMARILPFKQECAVMHSK